MSVVQTPLPQVLDAEKALLGCILRDPDALLTARSLRPSDFSDEAHATVFATMRQLHEDGLPVNFLTVRTRLERTGQLAQVGGGSFVSGLVQAAPTPAHPHYYVHLLQRATPDPASGSPASPQPAAPPARAPEPGEPDLTLTPEEARARLATMAPTLVSLDELMTQEFPPTLWVVPDLVPEGLTLLAAKPKLGKSWLALGLALSVASGGLALGKVQVEQGDVLYLALEDSPKRLHHRGSQLLRGAAAPERLQLGTDWPRLDEGGLGLLETWLQAHPDARLIILDTLAKIRGQARAATLYGDDYASLEHVQALAHEYGVGILVIHHTGKESREDPLDEVNATQGLNGVADNILVLRRERGKATATLVGDGRELNGIELTLSFDNTSGAWTQIEQERADQPKTPERAEILALLKASGEPMSPKQIADALGKAVNTVYTLLTRMVRDGDIKQARYGRYIPVEGVKAVKTVKSSLIKEDEENNNHTLLDTQEDASEPIPLTPFTALTGVREDEAEPEEEGGEALPRGERVIRWRDFTPQDGWADLDPRRYQPRPFGPIEGDEDYDEEEE